MLFITWAPSNGHYPQICLLACHVCSNHNNTVSHIICDFGTCRFKYPWVSNPQRRAPPGPSNPSSQVRKIFWAQAADNHPPPLQASELRPKNTTSGFGAKVWSDYFCPNKAFWDLSVLSGIFGPNGHSDAHKSHRQSSTASLGLRTSSVWMFGGLKGPETCGFNYPWVFLIYGSSRNRTPTDNICIAFKYKQLRAQS